MMTPRFHEDDVDMLRQLPDLLLRRGYVDFYAVYGVLHFRLARLREQSADLDEPLRTLVSLFLLGDAVTEDALRAALPDDHRRALHRLGVLVSANELVSTAGLVLVPLLGQVVFVPKPDGTPRFDEEAVLAARVTPPPGARCLNLCAGTGMNALRCVGLAASVLAIEVNPILVACVELSFALNRVSDRAEVRRGDLYAALAPGETFDYVVANPPVLPFPPGLLSPSADPDDDGLSLLRRLLDGLPAVLRPGGWAQLLASCVSDEAGPRLPGELDQLARARGLRAMVGVPGRLRMRPGDPLFEDLVGSSAAACALPIADVRERLADHFAPGGAEFLYALAITLSPDPGRAGATGIEHFRDSVGFWYK